MRFVRRIGFLTFGFFIYRAIALPKNSSIQHRAASTSDSTRGLHATLNAESCWDSDARFENVTFRLMNDSDHVLKSAPDSWVLIIDGKKASNPGGQLWMGGQPAGGYGTVASGITFQFGKGLPIAQYFPEARVYRMYWRAAMFRSNEVVIDRSIAAEQKKTCQKAAGL